MRAPESPFECYMSERILSFAYLINVSLSFWTQSAKKLCLQFAIFNFSEKLQTIFELGFKKNMESSYKIALIENYFKRKNLQTSFRCLCVNLPTVKIWGQSDKFPLSFSFL